MVSRYEKAPKVPPSEVPGGHLMERVIMVRRVAKTTTGGKHLRFNALVAVGDGRGHIGLGLAKAEAVPDAVAKARTIAAKNLIRVPLQGTTIPYEVEAKFNASRVLLKPAVPGTGVVAGATVRAIVELAGIKDVLTKALSNTNPINLAKATMEALASLQDPQEVMAHRERVRKGEGAPAPQP